MVAAAARPLLVVAGISFFRISNLRTVVRRPSTNALCQVSEDCNGRICNSIHHQHNPKKNGRFPDEGHWLYFAQPARLPPGLLHVRPPSRILRLDIKGRHLPRRGRTRASSVSQPRGRLVQNPKTQSIRHDRSSLRADRLRSPGTTARDEPFKRKIRWVVLEDAMILTNSQPQPLSAMEMVHKQPVTWTHSSMVACEGTGAAKGHPKIFINTDKPEIAICGYCGQPYVRLSVLFFFS